MATRNPDLIPGAPWWVNALIKLGAFGVLAVLLWQNNVQTSDTSKALVASNAKTIDRMPDIASQMGIVAAEIRDDNRRNAEFMKEHTATAVAARLSMDLKLATIQQDLVAIRAEQQKLYELFVRTAERIIGETPKNSPTPPTP